MTAPRGRLLSRPTTLVARRFGKVVDGGTTTQFVYDGSDLIAEYDGSGTLQRQYVHGPGEDEPLVWYEGSGTGTKKYMIADEQGSITAVADSTGALIAKRTYDEYGKPTDTNTPGRFGFTGQAYISEIGLYNYKARLYSPVLGRFMSPDPIGYDDGFNIYQYVHGDPINLRDPKGLIGEDITTPIIPGYTANEAFGDVLAEGCATVLASPGYIRGANPYRNEADGLCQTPEDRQGCEGTGAPQVNGACPILAEKSPALEGFDQAIRDGLRREPNIMAACLVAPFLGHFIAGDYAKATAGAVLRIGGFVTGTMKVGFDGQGGVTVNFSADVTVELGENVFVGVSAGLYVGDGGGLLSGGRPVPGLRGRADEVLGLEGSISDKGFAVGATFGFPTPTPVAASGVIVRQSLGEHTILICGK